MKHRWKRLLLCSVAGALLTPKRDEGGATLTDNTAFLIAGNTNDTIYIDSGDLTSVAQAGDVAGSLITFSSVRVYGRGDLTTTGDVLVAGDASSVHVSESSSLMAHVLEVQGAGVSLEVADSDLMAGGGALVAGDLVIGGASSVELGDLGAHVAGDLTLGDTSLLSLETGGLVCEGDLQTLGTSTLTMGTVI